MMNGEDALLVIAQVALGFVGFGAIVTALQPKAISTWAAQDRFRFWAFVNGSTFVIFAAILPFVVAANVTGDDTTWSISSAIYLAFVIVFALIFIPRGGKLVFEHAQTMTVGFLILATIFYLFAIGTLVLNSLGLWFRPQIGPYLLTIFLLQVVNAALFVRVLQFIGKGDAD